jgi:glycosyltransferase involved in cell wall biosynthesis
MKALFCHDHFYYTDDDLTLSKGQYHHTIWDRYLSHFESITVIGRDGGYVSRNEKNINISSGKNINFQLFNNINSFKGLIFKRYQLRHDIADLVSGHDVIILRGVSELGSLAYSEAKKQNKIIAFECVSCAFDELWFHGSLKAKIYSIFRFFQQKKWAKNSDAVIYVSQNFLQKRYPSNVNIIASASNVEVPKTAFLNINYDYKNNLKIGLIGTLKNKLKGVAIAIEAMQKLKSEGIDNIQLHILGPGDPVPFQKMIDDKLLQSNVFLDGIRTSGPNVWEWLRTCDLYIQPSFQEGVPRAMIEAMAQGLPCIGSDAGGVPELISSDWIFKRGNANMLAKKIKILTSDLSLMATEGQKNFVKAQEFENEKLSKIRFDFWKKVKEKAQSSI